MTPESTPVTPTPESETIYGLICISGQEINLAEEKPFIFDDDSHHFGPTQVSTQIKENLTQKRRIFQQKIENAYMTINLVNYALLASPSNFGERCGPFLQNYFDSKMETAITEGNDLLASVIPIAYVHNYTAKKYPAKASNDVVTYFGCYRYIVSFDKSDDRFLKIDPSGDLIEFEFSDSGLLHFCNTMEELGVTKIFAVVEDNTKELIEELSEVRQQIYEETGGETNALDTSSFLDKSMCLADYEEESVEGEERNFSALASLTEVMENVIESSDYELKIENEDGEKETDQSFMEHSKSSIEEETRHKRFRRLINEISASKREFKRLWFEGMENYELVLDPEFDAFMESYRIILHQDENGIKRAIEVIEDKAAEEFQKEEIAQESTEKENNIPSFGKMSMMNDDEEEGQRNLRSRKRRAPPTTPKTRVTPKQTKKVT
uniref:Uncharacterized protein n=1 Tax=Panagrolaimus davidi TaxID=227884 RepID=A0A914Q9F7_9BILA